MQLDELKNKVKVLEKKITSLQLSKEKDEKDLKTEMQNLESYKLLKTKSDKAMLLCKSHAANTRQNVIHTIESMITQALQSIYDPTYEFSFKLNEKAIEKGERGAWNITPSVSSGSGSNKIITTINSRGGGLSEVISVLIRLAFLKFYNYKGTVFLDETWASVSADDKMDKLIEFMKYYIEETDIQVVLITHRAEMFGKIANKINLVTKDSVESVSTVTEINYDNMVS